MRSTMTTGQGDPHRTKRRIYLRILPLATVITLAAGIYGLSVPDATLLNWALPFLAAAILAGFALGLRSWPEAFVALERTLMVSVFVIVAVALVGATLIATREHGEYLLTITRIGLWLPTVVAFGFLAVGVRLGAALAWALWGLLALLIVGHFVVPDGHTREELITLLESLAANGVAIMILSAFAQVARQTEQRAVAMEAAANTDALTQLANRRHAERVMEDEVERAERYGRPLATVLFDLDYFKNVNDAFGHEAGDRVLSEVRDLLRQRLRDSDVLARWGGEEFLLISPEMRLPEAARLAERLRRLVELHDFGTGGSLTASFGVAERREGETAAELVRRADEAMYAAKRDGRNTVRLAGRPGEPASEATAFG